MAASFLALAVLLIATTALCLEARDNGSDLESVTPANSVSPTTQEPQPGQTPEAQSIAEAATSQGLPEAFFRRFIWQESRFNPRAISNAGAQGIAQFMPGTARWRGLSARQGTVLLRSTDDEVACYVNFFCSGTGTTHSRQIVSSAAMMTGPRNRPSRPNVAIPPKIPTNANRNGNRAAPPTRVGHT